MRAMSKRDSIYVQLLRLLIFSAIAAGAVFLAMNMAGEIAISEYYYKSDYEGRQNRKYIERLQAYVEEQGLSSVDSEKLHSWVARQKILLLYIYKDKILIFDSSNPTEEVRQEEITFNPYEWEVYYTIQFADGEAQVSILGAYAYQFYNYAMIAELLLSFGLFLLLVILGIRKKMKYIRQLSHEIEILEGGSLDYEITVKGRDELSALAEGLDDMRKSFRKLIDQEAKILRESQKIVTEMSHDLRTPVTSIMLYTEILKTGKGQTEEQRREYIEKIDKKSRRMKQLIDHLFEYSLVTGETEIQLEEPETYEVLFYDLFSETCSYLEQSGFRVEFKVQWIDRRLRIYTSYITRIMDNITSNIIKYADPGQPVIIRTVYAKNLAGFSIENVRKQETEQKESTCVGLQSIKSMMVKMGGSCEIRQGGEQFEIEIRFPCVK